MSKMPKSDPSGTKKIKTWKRWLIIGLLLGLGIVRLKGLLVNPPSLFSDEVDEGYQAYVLNNCGTDYFGNKWPIHFQSFADFRTPLYIYSIAGLKKLGVESELAVRLPSALMGMTTVGGFFWLILLIWGNYWLAIVGMVLLAINPWWWHFSRGGWEVIGMVMCLEWGIICWIKYLKDKKFGWLLIGEALLVASFYFYATAKLMAIILGMLLLVIWKKEVREIEKKQLVIGLLFLALLSLPMIKDTIIGRAGYRFSYINIFSDPTRSKSIDTERYNDRLLMNKLEEIGVSPNWESKIAHNKFIYLLSRFGRNYVSSFSTDYLFLTGDGNLRQGFGTKGYLLYPDFFLILLGVGAIIFSKKYKSKLGYFMLGWLVLAPIPNALTRDSDFPNGTRLLLMLIPLLYVVMVGLKSVWQKKRWVLIILLGYGLSFADFYHYYNYHYPQLSIKSWHYGIKEMVTDAVKFASRSDKVYFSGRYEPMLQFFWFYNNYLPGNNSCQPAKELVKYNQSGFEGVGLEDKYFFGNLEWREVVRDETNLVNKIFVVSRMDMEQLMLIPGVKINYLENSTKKYTEQEKFWIIRLI